VNGDIDFRTPIDYRQLYAQLYHEIRHGERYWPTREQEQELMRRNIGFQQLNGLGEMLLAVIAKPEDDEDGQWMTLKEISALLRQSFKGYREDAGTFRKIGAILSRHELHFKSKHQNKGIAYWVKVVVE
jgi:hypothetical protein